MIAPLPSEASLGQLLTNLFDLPTSAKPTKSLANQDGCVAVFVTDGGQSAIFCVVDFNAGIALGSALARVPPAVAADFRESREFPAHLADNLREVINVMTSLFNNDEVEHLRLGPVTASGVTHFSDFMAQAAKAPSAASFVLSPKGYGEGTISFSMA